jgi:hypothetical protein
MAFVQGGRPVIYQPDEEFEGLPENYRWRHVRFDPSNGVDFTWEREWRIQTDQLCFDNSIAKVIVPSYDWVDRLQDDHQRDEDFKIEQYSLIFDEEMAEMYREEFPWVVEYREPE